MKNLSRFIPELLLVIFMSSHLSVCGARRPTSSNPGKVSTATGLPFNKEGGFQVQPFKKQDIGPGMVLVEGGAAIIGIFGENAGNSPKRVVTVTTFYMKETEVTNIEYNEYLFDLQKKGFDELYNAALPDEKVWVRELGYNDPYVTSYMTSPGFHFYPVVGVSWVQANNYCKWLTKKLNKPLKKDGEEDGGDDEDLDNSSEESEESTAFGYRLPTEVEWEYAARAVIGTQDLDLVQKTQRVYPWGDGISLRGKEGEWKGKYLANFKRSKGNYKGVPGEAAGDAPTSYVYAYPANDLGLYDMGGNVSEWVIDLYRPNSFQDVDDFNPTRRDDTLDSEKDYDPNNSLINNKARVYKGASWKDCAYWAQIGTRRYLDQDSARATIGFRYVVSSRGGDEGR